MMLKYHIGYFFTVSCDLVDKIEDVKICNYKNLRP